MQVVINISEKMYEDCKVRNTQHYSLYDFSSMIVNGTPIDLEGLKSDMKALNCGFPYGLDYLLDCLNKRLGITIIEADKSESENS